MVLGLMLWGCQASETSEAGDAQAAIDQAQVRDVQVGIDQVQVRDAQVSIDQAQVRDAPAANSQGDLGQSDLPRLDSGRDAGASPDVESPDVGRDRATADTAPITTVSGDALGMDRPKADGAGDVVSEVGTSSGPVTLGKAAVWLDCMPSTKPDPIMAMWTVKVSGARGTSVTVTSATVTVSNGTVSIVEKLTVDKPTISLVDGAGSADQRKPVLSGPAEDNQACMLMCKGATYRLDLIFDNEGQTFATSASSSLSCSLLIDSSVAPRLKGVVPDTCRPRRAICDVNRRNHAIRNRNIELTQDSGVFVL